ncbi:MAG: putative toxin-antitoxin system toxin component, PIN family [Actinomycetota bacterium]
MRTVLDTNVLISAFLFPGGAPETVFRLALEGRIELVTSTVLLTEFGRVLGERFGHEAARVSERIGQIIAVATITKPGTRVHEIGDDPDDDRVLEAALAGDATVIVSGDKHLLRLGTWRGIRILTPAAFLHEFESR